MSKLSETLKALNGKFGDNFIGIGSEILDIDYKRHSWGNFALDIAMGNGHPERKVVMLAGKESSGKTTSALLAIAETQKNKGKCAIVDVEHGFDAIWATKLGVNVKELIIAQATTIEQISDTVEPLIMTGEIDLIVVDSIASAPSIKQLEDSAEQKDMGGTAKAIGLMMKKITARLNDNNNPVTTRVILLNQIRDNVSGWGAPEYCPGGRQLHFQSDIIIWLRPDSMPVGGKEEPKGITVKFRVSKNRTAPPFKTGSYDLLFHGKIDNNKALVEKGIELGVIIKAGRWYSFDDYKQGSLDEFMENITPQLFDKIKKKVLDEINTPTTKKEVKEKSE